MAFSGTVNMLSIGKGRSSVKLSLSVFGIGQQFPRASSLTSGKQFDCSLRNHGINVYYFDGNVCRGITMN